jgi:hypothetical protein
MTRNTRPPQTGGRAGGGASARRRATPSPLEGLNTRLTYRTMRVVRVIGEQAGLSNYEISCRAGVSDQGQISKLLGRLARLGLLENTTVDREANGGANAWRLTPWGRRVDAAIAREVAAVWRSPDSAI